MSSTRVETAHLENGGIEGISDVGTNSEASVIAAEMQNKTLSTTRNPFPTLSVPVGTSRADPQLMQTISVFVMVA